MQRRIKEQSKEICKSKGSILDNFSVVNYLIEI